MASGKRNSSLTDNALSPSNRPHRRRLIVLGAALSLFALFALLWCFRAAVVSLYFNNSLFLLEKIDVSAEGDQKLTRAIREYLSSHNVVPCETLLTRIDLRELREGILEDDVELAPRIEKLSIRRIYPDKLQLSAVPRVPVATVIYRDSASGRVQTVKLDHNGYVLPKDATVRRGPIPSVVGVVAEPGEFVLGRETTHVGVKAFLAFLNCLAVDQNRSIYEVRICRLDKLENNQMILQLEARGPFRNNATVVLPSDDIPANFERLNIVVNLRMENNQTISYINARYEKIPVRP